MNNTKAYLGDSVYAQMQDGMIKLTTENGVRADNVIYLEPEVYAALVRYYSEYLERKATAMSNPTYLGDHMTPLQDFILTHCERGACRCCRCVDGPANPDLYQPGGHTADLIFFKVSVLGQPRAEDLRDLIKAHQGECYEMDLFDGKEHSFIEVGAWIGDQGLALMLMGLGALLGLWKLLTPRTIFGTLLSDDQVMTFAGRGLITVQA